MCDNGSANTPTSPGVQRPQVRRNSILVDYDVFMNVRRLDAEDVTSLQKLYKAEDLDFRLKSGSAAVDKGTPLPNVTEAFAGRAPYLGALELGAPPPHYGPRP